MANALLAIDKITQMCVAYWEMNYSFLRFISQQYDSSFSQQGAMIGTSLRIRLPIDPIVFDGPSASNQDVQERSVTLPVATQRGVAIPFSSIDMTMFVNSAETYIKPAIENLMGNVAQTIMAGADVGISNFVSNTDGSGNIIPPTQDTVARARARLSNSLVPSGPKRLIVSPDTNAKMAALLSGLFNPAVRVSEQNVSGEVTSAMGFRWYEDQTVINHTTGNYSGTKTVNGAGQIGTTIVVNAITGGLKAGDFVTFANVNAVNRITKISLGTLQQFVVTADVPSGGTSISIYPAIIPGGPGYDPISGLGGVQYQTVDASPANAATITVLTKAGEVYRKNFGFVEPAITMVMADLYVPPVGVVATRVRRNNTTLRVLQSWNNALNRLETRCDALFGYVWVRPEWAVIVADSI